MCHRERRQRITERVTVCDTVPNREERERERERERRQCITYRWGSAIRKRGYIVSRREESVCPER